MSKPGYQIKYKHFLLLVSTPAGNKLRTYKAAQESRAITKASHCHDCLAVIKVEEISESDYVKVLAANGQSKQRKGLLSVKGSKKVSVTEK